MLFNRVEDGILKDDPPANRTPLSGTKRMNEPSGRTNRRDFLAAAGLSTYSLLVLADGQAEASPPERSPAEIRDSFREIAPSTRL